MALEIEATGIDSLARALALAPLAMKSETFTAMEESVEYGKGVIAARTPVRTGRLASSWQTSADSFGGEVIGHIFTRVDYGGFVERGTRPHVIRPRYKQALFWPGAWHPVKSVRHPGFFGRHMGREGAAEALPGILAIFRRHMQRAMAATFRIR